MRKLSIMLITAAFAALLGFASPAGAQAAFSCSATENADGTVTVTWPNVGANGYDVIGDLGVDPPVWVTATSYRDRTPNRIYTVKAWGPNVRDLPRAQCEVPLDQFICSVAENADGSVRVSWTQLGANGYDVYHGASIAWVTGTSYRDATPEPGYRIDAWGNGTSGRTTFCVNNFYQDAFSCSVGANADGSVTVSWTDASAIAYEVQGSGGGGTVRVTSLSYRDFDPDAEYNVRASRQFPAEAISTTCVNPGGDTDPVFVCSATENADGTVTVSWTNVGANGYDVTGDVGADPAVWVTDTTYRDRTPNRIYEVRAWGPGLIGLVTECEVPVAEFLCSVVYNADGSATVSWTNFGAVGYDVHHGGGAIAWVTGTSYRDASAEGLYRVVAWGNGANGRTTFCGENVF